MTKKLRCLEMLRPGFGGRVDCRLAHGGPVYSLQFLGAAEAYPALPASSHAPMQL